MKLHALKPDALKLGAIAILFSINALKAQTATTLNFDGANDYVNCGTGITPYFTGGNKITVEAWVNPYSNTGYGEIAGNYNNSAGNMQFLLRRDYNNFTFWTSNGSFTGLTSAATVTVGTWTHLAGTWDGSVMSLYVNGILSGTTTASGSFPGTSNIMTIGGETASSSGTEFFVGSIDEVRIWNYNRTGTQIQSNMSCELGTGTPQAGLIAHYNFDEGIAAGSNPTVTTLFDYSGNFINGGLSNFALNGAISNWVSGSPALAAPILTITGSSILCAGSPSLITETVSGASSYTWSTGSNAASISVTPTASTVYTVLATAVNSCTNSASKSVYFYPLPVVAASSASPAICSGQSSTVSSTPGASYGLNFNGSNAYVNVSSNVNIPIGNSPYTLEAWIKPTAAGISGIVGWGNWGSVSQTNALRLNGATSVVNYWWNNDLTITCPNLADGFWHHIAATFDGTIRAIYVDGVKMGQDLPSGHNVPFSNNMRIGSTNNSEYFSGPIDDVRIWTIARTSDDIAGNMNNCLSGSEAGLVALYNMNNGPGSSTVSDLTSNANNGTLVNMNTTTDWVTGYNNCNVNYLWSPTAATTQSVIVTPAVSTVYTVNVTSFVGCSKAAVTSVTVNATPTLAISGSTAVCAGNSAVLTGSGANTYTWSTSANTTTISVSPAVPTTYSVTGTSSAGCTSSASATKTVSVNALPTLSISSSGTVVCSGQTASLTGSGANTYTWSTSANTSTISVSPTVTTTYSVNGTNAAGCTSSVSAVQTVSVNALPALSVSSSSTLLCSGQTASLTANGAGTYTWSTGANTSSITVTPSVTTSYTVSGTNSAGCSDVSVLTQSVSTCTGIEQADAAAGMSVYPNPNNGSFSVYIAAPLENGELLILNAIGQNVYRQVILQGTNTIRISDLTKGLYHYQVLRNKQVTGMGKLIVE